MSRKILEGIESFVDVFYKNCEYCSLFSILAYYKKDIEKVMFNEIYYFSYDKEARRLKHRTHYIKSFEKVIEEDLGVKIDKRMVRRSLIEEVKTSIDLGRPVIVYVDRYYQSIVTMFYKKMHGHHALLIYGYDEEREMFSVIEDNCHNIVPFDKYEMSFYDVIAAYEGYLEKFYEKLRLLPYQEYGMIRGDNVDKIESSTIKKQYIQEYRKQKDSVVNGVGCIQNLVTEFENSVEEKLFVPRTDEYEPMVWWIIQYKNTIKYKLGRLLELEETLKRQMGGIINKWNIVRNNLRMIQYKKENTNAFQEYVIQVMKELCDDEHDFADRLYKYWETLLRV